MKPRSSSLARSVRRCRPRRVNPRGMTMSTGAMARRISSSRSMHTRRGVTPKSRRAAALYEAFPAAEARRLLRRLEFHYVPKHASWLNMVEIEIGILSAQCLDRRIPDMVTLDYEVDAWTRDRNAAGARVRWMFGIEQARAKLGHAYPTTARREAAA
jgi:DDE superfamily endonuclease